MGALIHLFRLQPFIVTLAGMFLARGLCYLISVESITIDDPMFTAMSQTQVPILGGFLSPGAIIALVVLLVAIWVAHFTAFGRAVYAVGGNEQSAAMMGLNVGRTKVARVCAVAASARRWAACCSRSTCCPATACTARARSSTPSRPSSSAARCSRAATAISPAALSGVLVLGAIQTLIAFDGTLSSWWTKIVIGALLFVFCVVQRVMGGRSKQ